ncbi:FYVE and coiled-coil domain-containing protein 1-like isoform X3 [Lineus longissimus]|uniref:FYVE and coiled-coil domain-containing protein 1-like isoform X3 n=1 Tax=Lineus longissimus TaxID=88925 RepID=UPI00315D82E9
MNVHFFRFHISNIFCGRQVYKMAAAPVMDNPLTPQLSPQPKMQKIAQDVIDCIHELKKDFIDNQIPINDDNQTLQRLCAKLEYLLQVEQKVKTSFLGAKKDYWNYFCDCLQGVKGLNEGIKYVKSITELKTSVGRGRALMRFALMHQRLADTLQACVMNGRLTSDWYNAKSIWLKPNTSSVIINALYDLNDVQFDLAPRGYDLDASWPSFARKTFGSSFAWNSPSRSSSVTSLTGLGQDIPTLRLDTSNMSETSSLREEPFESFQTEADLYEKMERFKCDLEQLQEKDAMWKDKEKQWLEDLLSMKTLNTEQEMKIKALVDQVASKASVVNEKEASISHLNSKVSDLEHRNCGLITKVEGLIEEKNSGVSSQMDSANKAQEFLESLNESERKNNALILENAEVKVKLRIIEDKVTVAMDEVKVTKDELATCQIESESRRQQHESELLAMRDLKCDFEHRMKNAIQDLENDQLGFSDKERYWLQSEKELCAKLSELEMREKETCEVNEKARHDNAEFQSRLTRKDTVIGKQEQTISDLKYEIQDLTKRLENLDTLKEEKELELSRALKASQSLNSEIKIEIEQLKFELQEREGSVERELGTYNEKLRLLEEEKEVLQTRLDTFSKEQVEKQNLEMKLSDLETDKSDQVKMLEDERNCYSEAHQKCEGCLEVKEKIEGDLQQTVKEFEERDMEEKLEMAEGALKRGGIQEWEEKRSHLELNRSSSESELEQRNRSSSDLEETVSCRQTNVHHMESKVDDAEGWMHEEDMVHLQTSLVQAEERAHTLADEVEGLTSLVMLLDHHQLEISEVKDVPNVSKHLVAKVEYILQEKELNDAKCRHTEAGNVELRSQVRVLKQQLEEYANDLQHCQLENAELKTIVCQLENVEAETSRKLEMRTEIVEEQVVEIEKLEVKMKESVKTVHEMKSEMRRLEGCAAEAMLQVEQVQRENESKEADIEELRVDITEQVGQIEKLRVMIQEMDGEISGRDQRISQLDVMNKRLANEMKLLQDLVATANDSSTRFEKQIRSFEERITVMSGSFESLQHDNERLLSDKSRLMQENTRLQSQIEMVTDERKRLEDEQDMLEKSLIAAFEEKLVIAESKSRTESQRCEELQKQLDIKSGGTVKSGDKAASADNDNEEVTLALVCENEISVGNVTIENTQTSGARSDKQIKHLVSHLQTELQCALDKNSDLSSCVDELNHLLESLKEETVNYKQTVISLEHERDDVRSEFTKLNSVIESMCKENENLKSVISVKDNEVLELSQMISVVKEENVTLTKSLLDKQTTCGALEDQLAEECNAVQSAETSCRQLREQLGDLRHCAKTEAEKLQEKCDELVMKMLEVTKEYEDVSGKLDIEISGKEELQSQMRDLEEKLARGNVVVSITENEMVVPVTSETPPDRLDGVCHKEENKTGDLPTKDLQKSLAARSDEVEIGGEEVNVDEAQEVKVNEAAFIESLEDEILMLKQQNYDMEISLKCYVNQGMDVAKMLDRMTDQESLIQTLELELQEIRDEREIEREKQWNELEMLKDSLLNREDESRLLGDEVKRTSLLLDQERETVLKLKNEIQEYKKKMEEILNKKEHELMQEVGTSVELKKKLIKLIKEKDTLWQRSDKLEFKQRIKAAETWMDDTNVTHCLGCRSEFSFMLRKHHCRLCGRIYCHNCSNNWVLTTHTKGKSRVCNACFIERESGGENRHGGNGSDIEDDVSVQVPHLRSDSWRSFNSTPDPSDTSNKVLSVNVQAGPATSSSTIDSIDTPPQMNDLHPENVSFIPSPDVDIIITRGVQNKTDDSKLQQAEESTPNLTTSVTLSVDAISKTQHQSHEETTIRPGHMFAVPVLIDSPGIILCWEFSTDPKSITFSINYKESDTTPADQQQVLFNPCKCNAHRQMVEGELVAQKAGVYTLYFDNANSRYTSKHLKYKLQIKSPM